MSKEKILTKDQQEEVNAIQKRIRAAISKNEEENKTYTELPLRNLNHAVVSVLKIEPEDVKKGWTLWISTDMSINGYQVHLLKES